VYPPPGIDASGGSYRPRQIDSFVAEFLARTPTSGAGGPDIYGLTLFTIDVSGGKEEFADEYHKRKHVVRFYPQVGGFGL
jgi:hypothetical protein